MCHCNRAFGCGASASEDGIAKTTRKVSETVWGMITFWQSLRLKRLPDSKRETVLRAFVLRFVKGPEAPVFLLP